MHNMNSPGRKRRMPAAKSPEPDRQTKGRFSTKVGHFLEHFHISYFPEQPYHTYHFINKPYHFPPKVNYNVYSTVTSISSDSSYSVYDTVSSTAVTSSTLFST